MDPRHRNAGLFAVAATLTGGMYVANEAGLPYLPPLFFASLRFLVAAALLLPYVAHHSETLRPRTPTDYLSVLVSGGLIVAAANGFLFVGQQYTTSATAAVIVGLSPILTVGLAAVVLPGTRLSWRRVWGIVLGLAGVGIVASPDPSNLLATEFLGTGLVFLAALALATGGVALRRFEGSLSPLAISTWATLVGGLATLALSLASGEHVTAASWSSVALLAVVYNGVVATPIGYVAYFSLLEAVGPIRVNLLTYASPFVTALAGWLLLGEGVSPLTGVGFVVIFVGFVLVEFRALEREADRLRTSRS